MDAELEQQLTVFQDMLELVKHEPTDEHMAGLAQMMPQIIEVLTTIYQALYQWYLSIGAPAGASHQQFHTWLKTVNVRQA
jgi:hypothetical protein